MPEFLAAVIVNLVVFLVGGIIGAVFFGGFFPMAWVILAASWGVIIIGAVGCHCDCDW